MLCDLSRKLWFVVAITTITSIPSIRRTHHLVLKQCICVSAVSCIVVDNETINLNYDCSSPVLLQLFETVNATALTGGTLQWDEFSQRLEQLSSFLLRRGDGSWMLNHASFREWLVWREEGQDDRFLCDPRSGHTLLAFWLCRQEGKLNRQQTLELGHHILKAHIYKVGAHKRT